MFALARHTMSKLAILNDLEKCTKMSPSKHTEETVFIFWSGGFGSTFRVLDLLFNKRKIVQPIYVKLSTVSAANDLRKITKITHMILEQNSQARQNLLPLLVIDEVPSNPKFRHAFNELAQIKIIGTLNSHGQVTSHGKFAKLAEISWIVGHNVEVCIKEGYTRDRTMFLANRVQNGTFKKRWRKRFYPFIKLIFPICTVFQKTIEMLSIKHGWEDIMYISRKTKINARLLDDDVSLNPNALFENNDLTAAIGTAEKLETNLIHPTKYEHSTYTTFNKHKMIRNLANRVQHINKTKIKESLIETIKNTPIHTPPAPLYDTKAEAEVEAEAKAEVEAEATSAVVVKNNEGVKRTCEGSTVIEILANLRPVLRTILRDIQFHDEYYETLVETLLNNIRKHFDTFYSAEILHTFAEEIKHFAKPKFEKEFESFMRQRLQIFLEEQLWVYLESLPLGPLSLNQHKMALKKEFVVDQNLLMAALAKILEESMRNVVMQTLVWVEREENRMRIVGAMKKIEAANTRATAINSRRIKSKPKYSFKLVQRFRAFQDHQVVLNEVLNNDPRWTTNRGVHGRRSQIYDISNEYNRTNITHRIDGQWSICNKVKFAQNFARFLGKYIPQTYLIINRRFMQKPEPSVIRDRDVWFLKPSETYGGHGIRIASNPIRFLKMVKYNTTYVVQPHVPNIALIKNRKFDIRIYVLFTFKRGHPFNAYIFKDGMIKLTVDEYNEDSLRAENNLTNKTFQSGKRSYDPYELTMLFSEWEYYDIAFSNLKRALLDMQDVFCAKLNQNRGASSSRGGYWLAGLDVIYDQDLHPWILEINGNPGMNPVWNTPDRWEQFFVRAVRDIVDLAIVPLLEPRKKPEIGNFEFLFAQRNRGEFPNGRPSRRNRGSRRPKRLQ